MKPPVKSPTIQRFAQDFAPPRTIRTKECDTVGKLKLSEVTKASLIVCGHPIHPAYTSKYGHTLCPTCRMINSRAELMYSASVIDFQGGVGPWKDYNRHCAKMQTERHEQRLPWLRAVWGGSRSSRYKADLDENGKDWSRRHAKKRLHNLLDELEDLASQEMRWMEEKLQSGEGLLQLHGRVQTDYTAAFALLYYEKFKSEDYATKIEEDNAVWARKCGGELQFAAHAEYPLDLWETDDANHLTARQRSFLESDMPPRLDIYQSPIQSTKTKRHIKNRVTFSEEVYIRTDCDIDVLRHQASTSSANKSTPQYTTIPLYDGDRRPCGYCCRGWSRYVRGSWGASEGSVNVNTSGKGRDQIAWEAYVEELEEEVKPLSRDVWVWCFWMFVSVALFTSGVAWLALLMPWSY
ncbi:hypothetical protein BDU57DRAFT_540093 [Ampelomyces quisqualis]|uniref:Uncharacterized protein n=1 Tax=Ampelomyces quisqualis TaxID=50730 RepID=A0A6A5QFJ1_AMPQU|nr:hypothetical protein BDU57DRAFT_540093 [Ampelomyces quisqualis]